MYLIIQYVLKYILRDTYQSWTVQWRFRHFIFIFNVHTNTKCVYMYVHMLFFYFESKKKCRVARPQNDASVKRYGLANS